MIRRAFAVLAALPLAAALPAHAASPAPAPCPKSAKGECDDEANKAVNAALEHFQALAGDAQVDAAITLVDLVARNPGKLSEKTRSDIDFGLWIYMGDDKRNADGPEYARVIARMRSHAEQFRSAGNPEAELFFLDWMQNGVPYDDRLGHARLVHRRAAQLGQLDGPVGRSARVSMEIASETLLQEGRQDEVLRAFDDTWAELDAAGVKQASWEMQLAYAEALTLARRDEEADQRFAETLELLASGNEYQLQFANNQISYFHNIAGRFAAAEEPGRFAAVEGERLNGRESIGTQKSRYNFALALLGQGKANEALPYFEEALPLQLAVESDTWTGSRDDTVILLTTLARARAQVKGHEGAGLAAAVEAADRLRQKREAGLNSSDANPAVAALARAVAKGTRRNPLSGAFDMVMFAGWAARGGKADAMGPAFLAAQDLTLTDAGDAINEAAARDIAGAGPLGDLVRQRQDAAQAVVSLTRRYRDEALGKDEARAAALRKQLDEAATQLAPLDARIAAEFPDYATLVAPKSIDVAAVQKLLAPDEAVLMLLPSEGHHYAFAISKTKALWHRVDNGAAPVAADVARLKCRIDENTCSLADYNALQAAEARGPKSVIDERYPRYDRAAAYRLYQQLIAPVAAALPKDGRVYTVVSGPISGLPLAALVAKAPKGAAESGAAEDLAATEWLGKRYRFITLPSVSALALAQRAPDSDAARPPLVAYGAPVLLGSGEQAADNRGTGPRRRGGVGVRGSDFTAAAGDKTMASVDKLRRLSPLPGTAAELTRLSATIGKGGGARLGAEATETALKADTDLPRAVTVVFATHGLLPYEMGIGSEPGLVLTPPGKASIEDDGLLTASEAAALSLSAKWVVLSACNTATPGTEPGASGESLSSLARSFLYAGSDNLLASHWRFADDATAALIVEVLSNEQATPATALATAMEAVRTGRHKDGSPVEGWQPHWAHPASWAPFTLVTNRDR
ncbi:CHAT domain-containing protein [Sphingopyxis sp. BSN-002]|uniref:CHAT domain-containing protein n=1 Tax=Sphingopyxis sp. BSN-002 TaxID=2911495 RepID=UPI001ED9D77E|nr:CHAT domain-containing protein [Sphingopyxis sp. BSN-002]UKK83434.1 CHAT domain-containing protein [Sphingopyxis sp. BSN-002]